MQVFALAICIFAVLRFTFFEVTFNIKCGLCISWNSTNKRIIRSVLWLLHVSSCTHNVFTRSVSVVAVDNRQWLNDPGFESRQIRELFHCTKTSRPVLGPTQRPIQLVSGSLRGAKRPGRDVDHSSPSKPRAELSYICASPICFQGMCRNDFLQILFNFFGGYSVQCRLHQTFVRSPRRYYCG